MVLDEAMAFADAENELALREEWRELLQGKTVLMIAHRLYSIRDADCIYVLDSGRLAESGTHQELLDKNGLYAHLWAIRMRRKSWQMKGGVSLLNMIRQFTFHKPKEILQPTLWLFLSRRAACSRPFWPTWLSTLLAKRLWPPYTLDLFRLITLAALGVGCFVLQYKLS